MQRLCGIGIIAGLGMCVQAPAAFGQSAEIGVDALVQRLGATTPTGAGVIVGQVEAPETPGNYGPDQSHPDFAGKTFTAHSGSPGSSGHATLVGRNMYGNAIGMAPGITTIHLWEAASWLQTGFLRTLQGSAAPPLNPPAGLKIFNNSWIGSANPTFDNDALRRADFVVHRDHMIIINGVNNCGSPPCSPTDQRSLMAFMYNGIAVGLSDGNHVSGATLGGYDGPGRMKPEVVAPAQFTSFAAPYVDAVAARLVETARTWPGLAGNVSADRSETIKAAMFAGANHRPGWTNNPATSGPNRGVTSTPLHPHYGADVVNVNNSHFILTGLEQNGTLSPPASANIIRRGWDIVALLSNTVRYYRFRITSTTETLSVVAVWNRLVNSDFGGWSTADFTLTLYRVDAQGNLESLVGDAGVPYFGAGNVVSQSAVDNVEHLYIQNLQPGDYAIAAHRVDVLGGSRTVCVAWLWPRKAGDVNEDGTTNVTDLLGVINAWGACPAPCLPACPADLNSDCAVNVSDLLAVINGWG